MTTTLVVGGPRSGASRHAVELLAGQERVTCVTAPLSVPVLGGGPVPQEWRMVNTLDLTRALLNARGPVLIDNLASWLRGLLDDDGLGNDPQAAHARLDGLIDELAFASQALPYDIVIVTEEPAGSRYRPEDPREQLYADLLGEITRRLSASAAQVYAVLAGRVLDLNGTPAAGQGQLLSARR